MSTAGYRDKLIRRPRESALRRLKHAFGSQNRLTNETPTSW
jgi:hypothetical protein